MPLRSGSPLPSLDGATEWINGQPELVSGPVLVHFWSVSCHICKENMPGVREWIEAYGPRGLQVVAIHKPRQEMDTNVDNVKWFVNSLGITEPCAVDNEVKLSDSFDNEFVPAYFLFDADGNLRSRAAGHSGLTLLKGALERMFP